MFFRRWMKTLSLAALVCFSSATCTKEQELREVIEVEVKLLSEPPYKFHGRPIDRPAKVPLTDEELRQIAMHYKVYCDDKMTDEERAKLRSYNPDIKLTAYMPGSYFIEGDQAERAERECRINLAMTPIARLAAGGIGIRAEAFRLVPFEEDMMTAAGPGGRSGIPVIESKFEGDYSAPSDGSQGSMTESFVFWIRIENELMRVVRWIPETGRFQVTRRLDGTKAVAHYAGEVVCSPIYAGAKAQNDGAMKRDIPKGGGSVLAYCMEKATNCENAFRIKAEKCVELMEKGFDGVELDDLSTDLPMFNMGDCFGRPAKPWNFTKKDFWSVQDWIEGHQRQIHYMQTYVKDKTGRWPIIEANGLRYTTFEEEDGGAINLLRSTEIKPRSLDGLNSEAGVAVTGKQFAKQFTLMQKCAQEDLAGRFSDRQMSKLTTPEFYDKGIQYGYAMYLMAKEKDKHKMVMTLNAYTWKKVNGEWTRAIAFHPQYRWPLGDPVESAEPGNLDKYKIPGTEVLKRKFQNGIVLLNPTGPELAMDKDSMDSDLFPGTPDNEKEGESSGETYEIELETEMIDPDSKTFVSNVTMAPGSGKILLFEPELEGASDAETELQ